MSKAACFSIVSKNVLVILALAEPKIGKVEAYRKAEDIFFEQVFVIATLQEFKSHVHGIDLAWCHTVQSYRQRSAKRSTHDRQVIGHLQVILAIK